MQVVGRRLGMAFNFMYDAEDTKSNSEGGAKSFQMAAPSPVTAAVVPRQCR